MQKSILEHLRKARTRFVWLRGSPGTGKTAISMSIASTLHEQHNLAASFFWDKNQKGTGLDSLEGFPSTLSRQLAHWSDDFKVSLVKRLRNPDLELVQSLPLEKQMRVLIIEPMNDLMGIWALREGRVVIVLDGLDEC
ncbi:uncharacterized protein EI90DRAFT_2903345, partial [Cantharellus anzutake]|uniref:uncharacterized protein n=1 Tax=Cantharellus anzutake TaxID=1750568 RepID=UPI0019076988